VKNPITITGLDIGSSKIAAVTARMYDNGRIDIVARATCESAGIADGMLVDLNDSIDSVSKALTKLKAKAANRLGEIYVNISGQDVKGRKSVGMIPISLRGREIVQTDIENSINAASTIHLSLDREIIHKIVHSFSIDDQPWIRNPLGLYASRIACEVYVITANINHIQSIHKCVNDAGYDVKDIAFTGIADGMSLVDKETKESGAVLIDIGNSLTEVSVFLKGALDNFDVISFGSRSAGDGFRSNPVFDKAASEISTKLQDLSKAGIKTPLIILTGGFSLSDGMVEYLEEKLSHPVKMGTIRGVQGDISGLDSVSLATAIGLCGYAHEKRFLKSRGPIRNIRSRVVELFNNYF